MASLAWQALRIEAERWRNPGAEAPAAEPAPIHESRRRCPTCAAEHPQLVDTWTKCAACLAKHAPRPARKPRKPRAAKVAT
jgi:hypothetical protein